MKIKIDEAEIREVLEYFGSEHPMELVMDSPTILIPSIIEICAGEDDGEAECLLDDLYITKMLKDNFQ